MRAEISAATANLGLDDQVRALRAQFRFADLPGDTRHTMIVRIKVLEASGFTL